jgi:hypothetical protein
VVPAYRATDVCGWKTEAVIRRWVLLHPTNLPSAAFNLTMPSRLLHFGTGRPRRAGVVHYIRAMRTPCGRAD